MSRCGRGAVSVYCVRFRVREGEEQAVEPLLAPTERGLIPRGGGDGGRSGPRRSVRPRNWEAMVHTDCNVENTRMRIRDVKKVVLNHPYVSVVEDRISRFVFVVDSMPGRVVNA